MSSADPDRSVGTVDLDRFFHPRSVAVIGASDTEGSQAALNFRTLAGWAERVEATVHPVNPKRAEVLGRTCYASIREVPEAVDVAIILLSSHAAVAALEEVALTETPFAVLFAAGFAESGADGSALQAEVEQIVAASHLRVLGPNTTLNAYQEFRADLPGRRIALITQSGHQGRPLYQAQDIGIALSHWAPTGNEADLESADFITYFADQPETGAIACYIEGFKSGRTLVDAAHHAARRGVPIVAVKVGRTEVGRSWALSHSGHLTGSDAVTSAALRQLGITRVDGLDELLDTSMLLARAEPPRGEGVCIYSISGGTGAHISDLAIARGLSVPELTTETQEQLHEWISPFLRVSNPVDSGGIPTADSRGRKILEALVGDPNVAVIIVPIAGHVPYVSDRLAADIVAVSETTDKPICVIWGSPVGDEDAYREVLLGSQVPVFRSAGNCLGAVKAYLDFHAFCRRRSTSSATVAAREAAPAGVQRILQPGPLSEHESKRLLDAYGVPVTHDVLCASAQEAVRAASDVGYPCVMKVSSANIQHKSERGLVALGLSSEDEVRRAYDGLRSRAGTDETDGILVCESVTGGIETVLGVAPDELFGCVVMFGLGGVAVEVYADVSFRVPPFDADEARRMIEEIRAFPLLQGFRGRPPANLDALEDVIMRVQQMALDLGGSLRELDINPLVALPERVVALDALAVGG